MVSATFQISSDRSPFCRTVPLTASVMAPRDSSPVLAMGCSEDYSRSSLRFSLGHTSTRADVDALVEAIGIGFQRGTHTNWQLVSNDAISDLPLPDVPTR